MKLTRSQSTAAPNPAAFTRVLLGATASLLLMVLGLRWTLQARELMAGVPAVRPEFMELALRFAGIALLAVGQTIAILVVLPALFTQRRGEWLVAAGFAVVFLVAAVAAAVFALSGA